MFGNQDGRAGIRRRLARHADAGAAGKGEPFVALLTTGEVDCVGVLAPMAPKGGMGDAVERCAGGVVDLLVRRADRGTETLTVVVSAVLGIRGPTPRNPMTDSPVDGEAGWASADAARRGHALAVLLVEARSDAPDLGVRATLAAILSTELGPDAPPDLKEVRRSTEARWRADGAAERLEELSWTMSGPLGRDLRDVADADGLEEGLRGALHVLATDRALS